MKNILKRTLPFVYLLAVGLMVSCERTEIEVLDPGNGFVQVNNATGQISEGSADPAVIDILFGGSSNENGITVKYTIESDDASRFTDLSGGSVTIPAGEFSTQILIQPIDNNRSDGDVALNVILSNESSVAVGIGGGVNNAAKLLTIVDNDCPIGINDFVGTYTVEEVFSEGGGNAGLTLSGAFGESYQIQMNLDPNDDSGTKLIITNSDGFDTYIPNGVIMSFDTCNGIVSFDQTLNIALFADLTLAETAYNEGSYVIEANGTLGNFGAYEFKLTKQ